MIRTQKLPFLQSRAAWPLIISTILVGLIALVFVFTSFTAGLDFARLPLFYLPFLALLLLGYCTAVQLFKAIYVRKFHEWL
jgi:Mg2+-importing ATPase